MRNPKFKKIGPNYRKRVLEITLQEGKRSHHYNLPFAVLQGKKISPKNKFVSIEIDKELNHQGACFTLEDGSKGSFPSDLVLYYCDSTYEWSPLNQLKNAIREKIKKANLSLRVLADALHTSPSQVIRLLEENRVPKQLSQLFHLVELAGYHFEFHLKKKAA